MSAPSVSAPRQELFDVITEQVFVRNRDEQIDFTDNPEAWLFDFRRVLMNGRVANAVAEVFYEAHKDQYPFQLCSLEIAGVPLMTAIMCKFYERGHTDINAFFIRKSRKKSGLMRMVEGTIDEHLPIILVDDTMNRGNSFWRQVTALEELGHRVASVWSIVRYRDLEFYRRFHNRDIAVTSLFTLDDFTARLGDDVRNLIAPPEAPPRLPFSVEWAFQGPKPSYGHVIQKSQPTLDAERIYVGADDERFRAINQSDGSLAWEFAVGPAVRGKSIFSNPVLFEDLVIFGSYDGNIYGLRRATGELVWRFSDADWVGSSPALDAKAGRVFIGLEFGLIHRRGGIVALNARTGTRLWTDYTHPALTHATPYFIAEKGQVAIGSNDGVVRLYDATSGTLLWSTTTFGGASFDPGANRGFSDGDIKESFAYDAARDRLIVGSIDGFLYIIERRTGHLVHHFKCAHGIWSTPVISDDCVYFTSTDKHLRALDLDTLKLRFARNVDNTRLFASPTIIDGRLYLGTNAARLHELDPETGEPLGYFQATERITNHVVQNPATKRFFLPTYANQIICLSRRTDDSAV